MWGAPMWRVRISCLLALLAGWVDVICVVRYGAFAVTQTGNLIFMGMGLHSVLFRDGCDGRAREARRGAQAQGSSGGSEQDHFMACLNESEAMQQVFFTFIVLICSLLGAYAYAALQRRVVMRAASTAAPVLAALVVLADVIGSTEPAGAKSEGERWRIGETSRWSVCLVAFALGAVHYLSGTCPKSRLKGPVFAGTGHLHKCVSALWRLTMGESFKPAEREKALQSLGVVLCLATGALLGATALHYNPFDSQAEGDGWLLIPVALTLLVALTAHDRYVEPPGGWAPAALSEPLAPGAGEGAAGDAAGSDGSRSRAASVSLTQSGNVII